MRSINMHALIFIFGFRCFSVRFWACVYWKALQSEFKWLNELIFLFLFLLLLFAGMGWTNQKLNEFVFLFPPGLLGVSTETHYTIYLIHILWLVFRHTCTMRDNIGNKKSHRIFYISWPNHPFILRSKKFK